jgi:hypothetical protein
MGLSGGKTTIFPHRWRGLYAEFNHARNRETVNSQGFPRQSGLLYTQK